MPRPRNYVVRTVLGTLLSLVLPILGTAIAGMLFADFRLIHLPLHAVVEIGHKADKRHYPWMTAGLVA